MKSGKVKQEKEFSELSQQEFDSLYNKPVGETSENLSKYYDEIASENLDKPKPFARNKPEEYTQDIAEIYGEMAVAQAGKRHAVDGVGTVSSKTLFPSWIPDHLRSRKLFDKVMPRLLKDEIKYPKNKSELELYELILKRSGYKQKIPTADGMKERKFIDTMRKSPYTKREVQEGIKSEYIPITNVKTAEQAKNLIETNYDDAIRIAKDNGQPTAESNMISMSLIDKMQEQGRIEDAIDMVEKMAERNTGAGQAIQALSAWNRLSPTGMLKYTERVIRKANVADKNLNLKLTEEVASEVVEMAKAVRAMPEGRKKAIATAQLYNKVHEQVPVSILKKISTAQTMAMLLNPKTLIRNIVGNTGFLVGEMASDVVGAPIDKLASLATGNRTKFLPSLSTQYKGFKKGFKEGAEEVKAGVNLSGVKTQFDVSSKPVFKNKIGKGLEKLLNYGLRVTDKAAYQAAYGQSMLNQQKAKALGKGITDTAEEMAEQANFDGLYKTFQDDNAVSNAFVGMKKVLNLGKEWGAGDMILKFPKTPANLLKTGVEYSPAGFANTAFQLAKPLMKKEFDQKKMVEATSRALIGSSGLVGTGAMLQKLGIIQTERSRDYDKNSLDRDSGIGSYRINASALKRYILSGFDSEATKREEGDTHISYDCFQPFALSVSLGASMADSSDDVGAGAIGAIADSVEQGINTIAEQPMITGVTRTVKYGNLAQGLGAGAKSIPSSMIPTLSNQVNQYIDNNRRQTYDANPLIESYNKLKRKIPGLAQTLPVQSTAMGEDAKTYQDDSNTLFNVFLNPAFVSKYKTTPESKLVYDIIESTGEGKQIPRITKRNQTIYGIKTKLTASQLNDMQRYVGQTTAKAFGELVLDESFMNLGDEDKANVMSNMMTKIGKVAKVMFVGEKALAKARENGARNIDRYDKDYNKTIKAMQAEQVIEKLSQTPKEFASAELRKIQELDPQLLKAIIKIKEEQNRGLNYEDRRLLKLGVENNQRTESILDHIKTLNTNEEINIYVNDLIKKKVATRKVLKQLELRQQGYRMPPERRKDTNAGYTIPDKYEIPEATR